MGTSWRPPATLGNGSPRQVAMSRNYQWCLVGLITVPMFMTTFFLVFGGLDVHRNLMLRDRGVAVTGRITDLSITTSKSNHSYNVGYEFTLGRYTYPHRRGTTVSAADYAGLRMGQAVPVVCDPVDPRWAMLNLHDGVHREDPWNFFETIATIVLGTAVLFSLIVLLLIWGYRRERRLVEWGAVAPATLLGEQEYSTKNGRFARVTYRFTDLQGRAIEGKRFNVPVKGDRHSKSIALRARLFENPTALFDPHDSRKHLLYPPTSVALRQPAEMAAHALGRLPGPA